MHGVQVSLHWPPRVLGDLAAAHRVEATDLGYRFQGLDLGCPLRLLTAGIRQARAW